MLAARRTSAGVVLTLLELPANCWAKCSQVRTRWSLWRYNVRFSLLSLDIICTIIFAHARVHMLAYSADSRCPFLSPGDQAPIPNTCVPL